MQHNEFLIGHQFWCGGKRWRCTDIGTRVIVDEGVLVALHAFIKKTQKTPPSELTVARKRLKELKS